MKRSWRMNLRFSDICRNRGKWKYRW